MKRPKLAARQAGEGLAVRAQIFSSHPDCPTVVNPKDHRDISALGQVGALEEPPAHLPAATYGLRKDRDNFFLDLWGLNGEGVRWRMTPEDAAGPFA